MWKCRREEESRNKQLASAKERKRNDQEAEW